MPEPFWYYARGEVERGPFTIVQIKALANAGKLRRDDLVWKEGMENWTTAAEVGELFPTERATTENASVTPSPTGEAPATRPVPDRLHEGLDLSTLAVISGRGCLFIGLMCVVLVQGCESLGQRRATRLESLAQLQAIEDSQARIASLQAELSALQEKSKPTSTELSRMNEIYMQLNPEANLSPLTAEQRQAIARSEAEFRSGAFVRGLTFHTGILFLVAGGFALVIFSSGNDRWLGIGTLLIVSFAALTR